MSSFAKMWYGKETIRLTRFVLEVISENMGMKLGDIEDVVIDELMNSNAFDETDKLTKAMCSVSEMITGDDMMAKRIAITEPFYALTRDLEEDDVLDEETFDIILNRYKKLNR